MYLSSLQKFILLKIKSNISIEDLDLNSDEIKRFVTNHNKTKSNLDIINSSIDDLLDYKNKKEKDFISRPVSDYGIIELDSESHAHIYFYEPVISYFKIKPKTKFIKTENYIFHNKSEERKNFEILKRKYERKDGNHKRGQIRGECKFLKKAKASLSRSFSTLVKKNLLRKISIVNYENEEIGIGFNITELGLKIMDEKN